MKPAMLDTDILSEFLRGHQKVIANVDDYLKEHGFINLSIITYYEIFNGLLYKDAKKQLAKFEEFRSPEQSHSIDATYGKGGGSYPS